MIAVRIARARVDWIAAPIGALDRGGEARPRQRLVGEGLQRAHRADQLGRIGGGVGERVLRGARAPPHRAAEADERQHDHRNGGEHEEARAAGSSPPSWPPEPRNSTRLRSATETEEPTARLICVVSAVSREIISPVLAVSKKAADSAVRCANTPRAGRRRRARRAW